MQVVVGNPGLVQTGLDLTGALDFPTLVFYQAPLSAYTLRQASRRSHRRTFPSTTDSPMCGIRTGVPLDCDAATVGQYAASFESAATSRSRSAYAAIFAMSASCFCSRSLASSHRWYRTCCK